MPTEIVADRVERTFASLGLPFEFTDLLASRGIREPLPIQALAIPDALAGRDVAGKAPTGSGKTLAFALPMALRLRRNGSRKPKGLILAPTRELAAQISAELAPFARVQGLSTVCVYGGVGYDSQIKALRRGVDIVVACPGRLEDLVSAGHARLDDVSFVVIDEADRMADMGFLPAVRRILDLVRNDRQTLLFSATLDGDVDVLMRSYQRQPVRHEVQPEPSGDARVEYRFMHVAREDRVATCAGLVAEHGMAIVFVRTKHGADRLARQLGNAGASAAVLHGDRSQGQRERALAAFRGRRVQALIATDVAARGIHVDDVACVIHFDLAEEPKAFVHRSGRTARAGAGGLVVALITPETRDLASALRRELMLGGEVSEPALTTRPSRRPRARAGQSNRPHRRASTAARRPR